MDSLHICNHFDLVGSSLCDSILDTITLKLSCVMSILYHYDVFSHLFSQDSLYNRDCNTDKRLSTFMDFLGSEIPIKYDGNKHYIMDGYGINGSVCI